MTEKSRALKVAAVSAGVAVYMMVAVIAALWLAGVLFFLFHKALPQDVTPLTWLSYADAYWGQQRPQALLMASLFGGVIVAFAPAFALSIHLSRDKRELHGSARFATPGDVRKAGLMDETGMIVGKYRGHFLQFPGQQFCLLAAPTRSGKGVAFVLPNLLNWPDSCVVLDIKLENFLLTSKFRAAHGQAVFLFNPFADDYRTHRWNPLDGVSRDPNVRVGDLQTLATSLYPATPGDKDAFWAESARNLFLGLALMVMESGDLPVTLGEILRQSGGGGKGLKVQLTERIHARAVAQKPFSTDCIEALNRFLSASENTLANIVSTFTAPLTLFANPLVDAATAHSDFDIREVRDRKMTIYVGIQPNRLAEASLLINLFFSQLIHANTRTLPSRERHSRPCLLILDEFTAMGRINILARANAFIAGYNLRLLTIVQSVAQLEATYGPNDARALVTNHAMQVLFTPREQRDANAYSEMLGYYTIKATSKGRSTNRGFSSGGSDSENVSDQRRALMLPQELKELPDAEQVILYENTRPIRCDKARYYSEAVFVDRLKAQSPHLGKLKGLPDRRQLEQAAFIDRELSVAVPVLDVAAHIDATRRRERTHTLGAGGIDLSKLTPDAVPPLADPITPSDADINQMLDGVFEAIGVDTQDVMRQLFGAAPETDNLIMEA
ncbi:type IV secretory system conjugative DNA transfer family protein [Asticcacaulis sp. W401b]|uniref:type IV secretory system conjugative DNA transfer family protein n=1 Tax=Asticcacaulis sp. W401b TaxID=3388666 RepID=UPI003970B444